MIEDPDVRDHLIWLHVRRRDMPNTLRNFVVCGLIRSRLHDTSELDVLAAARQRADFTEYGYRDAVAFFEEYLAGITPMITDEHSIHRQLRQHCAYRA